MKSISILLISSFLMSVSLNLNAQKKPNILYILADDLGYADLSIQGCEHFQTPNIDTIFKNGVRFTQGYVSNSVCAPSRAGLLTGRMGSRFGFESNLPHKKASLPGSTIGLDPKEKTIADILKPAGYKSYCIGKWHLGDNQELFHPNKRGFDEFLGLIGGSRSYFKIEKDPVKSLMHNHEYIEEPEDLYMTDFLTDKAIEYIKNQKQETPEKPFFMYLSYTAPHGPMDAKESDKARITAKINNKKRKIFAAMMVNLDDNVGRVLQCLEDLDILENTMVVFMSDNGGPLSHNGSNNGVLKGKKGTLYEGGVRVPFAIQWKGKIPTGTTIDEKVISVDLLPTFAAISEADTLTDFETDGLNLMPLVTNEIPSLGNRSFYWRRGMTKQVGLRSGKYKYMKNRNSDDEFLYNLDSDISEKTNLKDQLPEVMSEMREKYATWESTIPQPAFSSDWKPGKGKKH